MTYAAQADKASSKTTSRESKGGSHRAESRHTISLGSSLAGRVERYARNADTSMSKALATLIRFGLESQEKRKREFFRKLRNNLNNNDPKQQDRLVDEFRALILGR
jgi:hypothetical protein